jgi:hypothetical protein
VQLDSFPLNVAALVQRNHDPVHLESPATRAATWLDDASPADRAQVGKTPRRQPDPGASAPRPR